MYLVVVVVVAGGGGAGAGAGGPGGAGEFSHIPYTPYYNSCSSMCVQVYKCSTISIHLGSIQFVFIPCIHVV